MSRQKPIQTLALGVVTTLLMWIAPSFAAAVTFTGISPTTATVGTVLTITGSGFGNQPGIVTAYYTCGLQNPLTNISWTDTQIKASVPASWAAVTGSCVLQVNTANNQSVTADSNHPVTFAAQGSGTNPSPTPPVIPSSSPGNNTTPPTSGNTQPGQGSGLGLGQTTNTDNPYTTPALSTGDSSVGNNGNLISSGAPADETLSGLFAASLMLASLIYLGLRKKQVRPD